MKYQTIFGAGAIGKELAKALTTYTKHIKIASRNPKKVNTTDTLAKVDLLLYEQVKEAIKDSEIVYLTAGLTYNAKEWQRDWPVVMRNLIEACFEHNCKLVFFDNIYMYDGSNLNPITEETPINPPSKKGKVRKQIADMLLDAIEKKGLKALIARCPDFYGPGTDNSYLLEAIFKPLSQDKTANWFVSDKFKHSFTYTVDAGKATALLGNTPDAYGQVWHLPTVPDPLTGKQLIELIANEMGVKPKYRNVSKTMVKFLGLFNPILKESFEMLYQYDKDYVFNSDKFLNTFSFETTPYHTGIKNIIQIDFPSVDKEK